MELDESTSNVFVIGAGVSGLTAAYEISKYLPTIVIDRLPLIGGTHANYQNKLAISLKHKCDESGVRFLLGNTALRWAPSYQLLVVGPAGIQWLPGNHLVYAGGIRPSTQAELGILGNRLGGVLACTVAKHFLESGVCLGHRVVILGNGNSAMHVGKDVAKQGNQVIVLSMDDLGERPGYADEWWPQWTPLSIHGNGRVKEILIGKNGMKERILCDAVIFAERMRPLRNIDGAIFDHESNAVTFAQLVSDTPSLEQRSAYASEIAIKLLTVLRR